MGKDDVVVETEQDPAERARILSERMHQLRLSGQILISLGGFLITISDHVMGLQSAEVDAEPNPGNWFGR